MLGGNSVVLSWAFALYFLGVFVLFLALLGMLCLAGIVLSSLGPSLCVYVGVPRFFLGIVWDVLLGVQRIVLSWAVVLCFCGADGLFSGYLCDCSFAGIGVSISVCCLFVV